MSNNPNSVVVWGGGANKPLINSLNTLNTLKNSNPIYYAFVHNSPS